MLVPSSSSPLRSQAAPSSARPSEAGSAASAAPARPGSPRPPPADKLLDQSAVIDAMASKCGLQHAAAIFLRSERFPDIQHLLLQKLRWGLNEFPELSAEYIPSCSLEQINLLLRDGGAASSAAPAEGSQTPQEKGGVADTPVSDAASAASAASQSTASDDSQAEPKAADAAGEQPESPAEQQQQQKGAAPARANGHHPGPEPSAESPAAAAAAAAAMAHQLGLVAPPPAPEVEACEGIPAKVAFDVIVLWVAASMTARLTHLDPLLQAAVNFKRMTRAQLTDCR